MREYPTRLSSTCSPKIARTLMDSLPSPCSPRSVMQVRHEQGLVIVDLKPARRGRRSRRDGLSDLDSPTCPLTALRPAPIPPIPKRGEGTLFWVPALAETACSKARHPRPPAPETPAPGSIRLLRALYSRSRATQHESRDRSENRPKEPPRQVGLGQLLGLVRIDPPGFRYRPLADKSCLGGSR